MKIKKITGLLFFCLIVINLFAQQETIIERSTQAQTLVANLQSLFQKPPQSAKTQVWWHWVNGNITREGITKDLKAMQKQGIGGATVLNIGRSGIDYGPVKFMSDQWRDLFQYALKEANQYGMEIGVHNCDGFSSSGGPWIMPEHAMKKIVWTKKKIIGGGLKSIALPAFVEGIRTDYKVPKAEFELMQSGFYRDIAVLAFQDQRINNAYHKAKPKLTISNGSDASKVRDGNPASYVNVSLYPKGKPERWLYEFGDDYTSHLDIKFDKPYTASKITILPQPSNPWSPLPTIARCELQLKNGQSFKTIHRFEFDSWDQLVKVSFPRITGKHFRVKFTLNENVRVMLFIKELELLPDGENPVYDPVITNLEQKYGGAVKPSPDMCYAENPEGSPDTFIPIKNIIDITEKLSENGTLNWQVPEGNWTIYRFGYTITGETNHPASPEGLGLECDKMDTTSVQIHFNGMLKKLINDAGPLAGNTLKFSLIDSWEVQFQTWTKHFRKEFQQRRGYDCLPYLPILAGEVIGNIETAERFLHDFRWTISDLISDYYYGRLQKLSHVNGLEFHAEAIYGGAGHPPVDVLKCNDKLDVPMSEFWVARLNGQLRRTILPSATTAQQTSALELFGPTVHAAEAFTSGVNYEFDFYDLKDIGDQAFCKGINRFVLHCSTHQPNDQKPGWTMGQPGMSFNRNNTWWFQASGWISYLNRCQALLQTGQLVADVCYFYGDNIPSYDGERTLTQLPRGYRSITCNKDVIQNKLSIENGQIVLPNGNCFKLLVLPERKTMELKTLQSLARLIEEGATVVGPKPLRTLSLNNYPQSEMQLRQLANKVWGNVDGQSTTENQYGKGKVIWGKALEQILSEQNVAPDFQWKSMGRDAHLIFVHRNIENTEIYFVANQDSSSVIADCVFRVGDKQPEIWHPETGEITKPALFQKKDGQISLPIDFGPRESIFIVFQEPSTSQHVVALLKDNNALYPFEHNTEMTCLPKLYFNKGKIKFYDAESGRYTLTVSNGQKKCVKIKSTEKDIHITNIWDVTFDPEWGECQLVQYKELDSWTVHKNPKVKFYSGTAIYKTTLAIPKTFFKENHKIRLNLGNVKNIATVKLNNQPLGVLWKPPFEIDITKAARKDENQLEVHVTNLWHNRLIGDLFLPVDNRKTWTTYPYEGSLTKESPLLKSGLLGPVTIKSKPIKTLRIQ